MARKIYEQATNALGQLTGLQLGHMSSRVKDNDARAHRLIERVVAESPTS